MRVIFGGFGKGCDVKPRWMIASIAAILAAVLAAAFWPGEKEPEYQGKKLSEWLQGYNGPQATGFYRGEVWVEWVPQDEQSQAVDNAIQAIGTNGLPLLIKWVEYQIPPWRIRMLKVYVKLPSWMQSQAIGIRIGSDRKSTRLNSSHVSLDRKSVV